MPGRFFINIVFMIIVEAACGDGGHVSRAVRAWEPSFVRQPLRIECFFTALLFFTLTAAPLFSLIYNANAAINLTEVLLREDPGGNTRN